MERIPVQPSVPTSLKVYVFPGAERADKVFQAIQKVEHELTTVKLGNIAVVRREGTGAVTFHESADLPKRSGIAGKLPFVGMVAAVVAQRRGLLKTTPSTAALLGGALGLTVAVIVNIVDLGFGDDMLQDLGTRLDAGTSALIVHDAAEEEPLIASIVRAAGGTPVQDARAPHISAPIVDPMVA